MQHLADFIQEELDARGWTLDDLALRMGGDFGIDRLALDMFFEVREKDVVLGGMAQGLSQALGVSPSFFIAIHDQWRREQQKGVEG